MNDSIVVRIGTACNVTVAVLLGTLGTIEMFDPVGALSFIVLGIPTSDIAATQLVRHLVAVMGGLHVGLAVALLLSARMDSQSRQAVSVAVFASLVLPVATVFRQPGFVGQETK